MKKEFKNNEMNKNISINYENLINNNNNNFNIIDNNLNNMTFFENINNSNFNSPAPKNIDNNLLNNFSPFTFGKNYNSNNNSSNIDSDNIYSTPKIKINKDNIEYKIYYEKVKYLLNPLLISESKKNIFENEKIDENKNNNKLFIPEFEYLILDDNDKNLFAMYIDINFPLFEEVVNLMKNKNIKNKNDFDYYLAVAFLLFKLRKSLNDNNKKYVLSNIPINEINNEFKNNNIILLNEESFDYENNNNYYSILKLYPYNYINIFNMILNIIILSIKNINDFDYFIYL